MQNKEYFDEMHFMIEVINESFDATDFYIHSQNEIEQKEPYDIVTSIDKKIEKFIVKRIKERFPDDNILSEEFHNKEIIKDRTWTIDPIDGTCNMANMIPQFSIQISFIVNNTITCSAIKTYNSELFYAQKNHGAFCNGKRIYSTPRELNMSMASFGDFSHSSKENSDNTLVAVAALKDHIMKIRFFGAASLDYAYLAAGRTDLVFMYTRKPWDIFPGILLCQEAGCLVCGMDGKPYNLSSPGVIATNNEKLLKLVLNQTIKP